MNRLCCGRTPKSPSDPGTTTMSTSALASSRSGATSWKATLSAAPSATAPGPYTSAAMRLAFSTASSIGPTM